MDRLHLDQEAPGEPLNLSDVVGGCARDPHKDRLVSTERMAGVGWGRLGAPLGHVTTAR